MTPNTRPPAEQRQAFAAGLASIQGELSSLRETNPHGSPAIRSRLGLSLAHLRSIQEQLREFDHKAARRRF